MSDMATSIGAARAAGLEGHADQLKAQLDRLGEVTFGLVGLGSDVAKRALAQHPDRFVATAMVPLQSPQAAARARRSVPSCWHPGGARRSPTPRTRARCR